jgi:hypothetical protein
MASVRTTSARCFPVSPSRDFPDSAQDFVNERMVAQGKAKATVSKQVSGIRGYWDHLRSLDESLRERWPFADLIQAQCSARQATRIFASRMTMMDRDLTLLLSFVSGKKQTAEGSLTSVMS